MINKLDNPVWHSLSEVHKSFSINYKDLKFYAPDFCPFGSSKDERDASSQIDEYSELADNFFIVGIRPKVSDRIILKNELVCLQMIIESLIDLEIKKEIIKLNGKHDDALFDLVNLVQPGYFKKKTALMGDYFGIFMDGRLVSVTGERMKMDESTEVSAVVTHPLFTGRGYAKQLVAYTVNQIFKQNKIPYLHVAEKNNSAIRLYEALGFKTRRKISFWNLIRNPGDNKMYNDAIAT